MNILEAISVANHFVFSKTGKQRMPDFARLAERNGKPAWWVSYSARTGMQDDSTLAGTLDGGEYIVIVDLSSGLPSALRS